MIVLGADTTVTIDGHILAKPADPADAARMLHHPLRPHSSRHYRRRRCVAKGVEVASEITSVQFLALSDDEIAAYIATGEPMDKAGAYGIQGLAAKWIPRIEGCYFNVVGLPLALVSTDAECDWLLAAGFRLSAISVVLRPALPGTLNGSSKEFQRALKQADG